jgi:hypothetical protein
MPNHFFVDFYELRKRSRQRFPGRIGGPGSRLTDEDNVPEQ